MADRPSLFILYTIYFIKTKRLVSFILFLKFTLLFMLFLYGNSNNMRGSILTSCRSVPPVTEVRGLFPLR